MNYREIRESVFRDYLFRVDSVDTSGKSTTDAWHEFLKAETGLDGSLTDLEKIWLHAEGATGEYLTTLWANYMNIHVEASGPGLADRIRDFFTKPAQVSTGKIQQETAFNVLLENTGILLQE